MQREPAGVGLGAPARRVRRAERRREAQADRGRSGVLAGQRGAPLDPRRITDRSSGEREAQPVSAIADAQFCPSPIVLKKQRTCSTTGTVLRVDRVVLDCNRKSCPYCSRQLRAKYVAHYVDKLSDLPHKWWATLTVDPKVGIAAEESRQYLLHVWSKFRKRLARVDPELQFVASLEQMGSGYWHLHAVLSCNTSEEGLRSHWKQSGGGAVCEFDPLDGHERQETVRNHVARVLGYVLKYAFKDATAGDEEGECRRSLLVSHGRGLSYHSEQAKEERRKYMEEAGVIEAQPEEGQEQPLTADEKEAVRYRIVDELAHAFERGTALRLVGELHPVEVLGSQGFDVGIKTHDGEFRVVSAFQLEPVTTTDRSWRPTYDEWIAPKGGGVKPDPFRITDEQHQRFQDLDLSQTTTVYRTRKKHTGEWYEYEYDRETGECIRMERLPDGYSQRRRESDA